LDETIASKISNQRILQSADESYGVRDQPASLSRKRNRLAVLNVVEWIPLLLRTHHPRQVATAILFAGLWN
jgi:hypothetical protein